MLADSAYKDDSFCKLYEQHLEESKEKDDLIMELKAALADNDKEISDLRSVVKEILYNRIWKSSMTHGSNVDRVKVT